MKKHQGRQWKPLQLKVYRELETAKLPAKSHTTDHCFDFYAAESITIRPGETVIVQLGLRVELPKGYALVFKERSGLACKGIIVGAGVIDEEYRGPLAVVLRWMIPLDFDVWEQACKKPFQPAIQADRYKINIGDKIAQGKLERTLQTNVIEVTKDQFLTKTHRGEKGFGSSGTK